MSVAPFVRFPFFVHVQLDVPLPVLARSDVLFREVIEADGEGDCVVLTEALAPTAKDFVAHRSMGAFAPVWLLVD